MSWEKELVFRNGDNLVLVMFTFKCSKYPVRDVCQIVGNVELKLRKYRSGNQVHGDIKVVEVKIS